MAKEYSYKRYQLSLDENDIKQKQIIEYLEQYKAGKTRNSALIKLLLVAMGEKIEIDALPPQSTAFVTTEARLKRMDGKLDKILWNLINRYGFTDIVEDIEEENDITDIEEEETAEVAATLSDNQVPGQMSFDDMTIDETEEDIDTKFGSDEAQKSEPVPNVEENNEGITLETNTDADAISKEMVASAFGMPSPSAQDEATEGDDDDADFFVPEGVMSFLDNL